MADSRPVRGPVTIRLPAGAAAMPAGLRGVTARAAPGHGWRDCCPEVLGSPGAVPADETALAMAWSVVTPADRRLFHQFCCLRRQGPGQLAAMTRIAAVIQAALRGPP